MESFGRYQLIRKLATGGMAEIYLARQGGLEGFEKLLVLKRILPHLAENDEFVEMFLHEARIAVRLNHPNIVQIYDLGEQDGAFFIAMEYIHGDDVRKVWKRGDALQNPVPVPLVCRIVIDAAAGLDYAHKRLDQNGRPLNIIHRDVSPQNILVSFEGAVKVVDFGIAKAADQATVTRSGVLKGKYSYMSPEQAGGKDIDHRTDQFALGVVLHELLTCKRLFKRGSEIQTLAAVSECAVPRPSEVNDRVPKELDAIVMKALAREPEHRYADLRGLRQALEDFLVEHRLQGTNSHLGAYLHDIFSDRLEAEAALGQPLFDEPSGPISNESVDGARTGRRRTGQSRVARGTTGETSRAARGRRLQPSPAADATSASMPTAPSQTTNPDDDGGTMTGSSVSRLVNKLENRKKAALGVLAAAAVAGFGAVFVYQQSVNSTTAHPAIEPKTGPTPAVAEPPPKPKFAGLRVVTSPAGATVHLDARALEGKSPVTVDELALGEHQLFVESPGYAAAKETVQLTREGEIVEVKVELQREAAPRHDEATAEPPKNTARPVLAMGTVAVDSNIPASIWEGTRELGKTPLKVKLPPGQHQLKLANPEQLLDYGFSLTVHPGDNEPRNFSFQKGDVQVVARPLGVGADIYDRGRKLGSVPGPAISLLEGEHVLTVVSDGEDKKTRKVPVTVKPGKSQKVTVDFSE